MKRRNVSWAIFLPCCPLSSRTHPVVIVGPGQFTAGGGGGAAASAWKSG